VFSFIKNRNNLAICHQPEKYCHHRLKVHQYALNYDQLELSIFGITVTCKHGEGKGKEINGKIDRVVILEGESKELIKRGKWLEKKIESEVRLKK
jgi:hypothetical protein